jgi:hypothetical protein
MGSITPTQTAIPVKWVGYSRFYATQNSRRDIAFLKTDGSWIFRRIVAATDQGTTELLTLDESLGGAYSPSDFELICFLELCRLDADLVELSRETDEFAISTIRFRSVLYQ